MTSKLTRERIELIANFHRAMTLPPSHAEIEELARMALAAMDSESGCLPLDYLQGHKDGLEWAARLAEANHPETGDWLYDDPIELAKAIRKGPDMQPAQPVADSEPVIVVGDDGGDALSYRRLIQSFEPGTKLYRHAQPAPIAPVCTYPSGDGSLRWPCPVHPGSSPVIPDGYVMVPMRLTAENGAKGALSGEFSEIKFVNCPECFGDDECETCDGSGRIEITVPVTWTTIKEIWAKGVEHFAAAPQSPGSEPATVPGKWIPVSERMPESNGMYFGWDGKRVLEVYCFFGGFSANQFIHGEITHWMPLPAAPQEVNHG
ncbi:Eaa1 [Klebsiella pneumoniae]|nr:Eaa1 [Klebsiella pneumoniae]